MGGSEKLSARKRVTLWALMLIIKIVEPADYSHKYEKELNEIKALIKNI